MACPKFFRCPHLLPCFTNKYSTSSYLTDIPVVCPPPIPSVCSNIKRTKKMDLVSITGFIQTSLSVQRKG